MSNKALSTVLLEAIFVGILLIPFTYVAGFVASKIASKPSLPDICKSWNKNYIMEINLFLAGFLMHFVFEYIGVNRWYAKTYP